MNTKDEAVKNGRECCALIRKSIIKILGVKNEDFQTTSTDGAAPGWSQNFYTHQFESAGPKPRPFFTARGFHYLINYP